MKHYFMSITQSSYWFFKASKPWEECLVENRKIWKERSVSGNFYK